ncbi:pentapeptide repeat-containing protein [Nostocaceae cyanobacterium CENA357]|uniref:Pentapeptide repeat-containing protein n=1 Tax=Atlanticothrix silvestris CENA357 TaxID=1725252 RepID=A0A8J7HBH1_9CYAN|nr:pentapeptide repeat-containing protein [Atlanticothrix silvestris]MBH8552524.1 pentapeptide repeat-containing protein [Atlanticothrix silvestris CENA357]
MNFNIRHWLAERHIEINHIREFSFGQLAGIAYRIVQDMEVKSLMPFDICTLAEVLELPLGAVGEEITVIALLSESLLRSLSQKKALKRNEGTWLTFQIAYLRALRQILDQEESLQRPWLNRAMIPSQPLVKEGIAKPLLQDAQLQGLLKTLSPGKLSDTQAEQALFLVADSFLVQQMNNAAVAWFVANGAEELEAKLLTHRLTHALPGHLLRVIAQNAPPLAQLQKFFRLGTASDTQNLASGSLGISSASTVGDKIDLHRENYRASLLQSLSTPLLIESFALKDIYVPLVGLPMEKKTTSQIDLKTWAQQQLADLATIAVIESESGCGKTSFCQIWAAQVAQEFYPTWMPIIIRLRDVKYGSTLTETLSSAFCANFHINLATWLEQDYPRCLLLLDGLDELPPSPQGKRTKTIFIQQLLKFQSEHRHKILLTSRTAALQETSPEMSLQWQRIAIQPLEAEELKRWFQQWATVQSLPIAQNYFTFLKQTGLFASKSLSPELSNLVRQPLMLYLLGVLHRDGLFDDEVLQLAANSQKANNAGLLSEIYHRLSQWLLGYPLTGEIKTMLLRSGSAHIHRTQEALANLLSGRYPQDLLAQMQAIALQILHSDRHQVTLSGELSTNTLPIFYFRSFVNPQVPQIITTEFSHPKLGEYLCAEAMAAQLQILTQCQKDTYGTFRFILDSASSVAQHLYQLLGYGILTPKIAELVIKSLQRQQKSNFSWEVLLPRLESFWRAYCQGRWLDEGIAHQVLTYFHTLQNPVNVEQINANVGLNVFLLLNAGYQEIKISFCPCGNPANMTEFYPEALLVLIGRAAILSNSTFTKRIHSLARLNPSGAYLLQVMLVGINLEHTNLSDAVLIGANLADANLTGADFTGADLTGANLAGANLTHVNLTGANLTGANLTHINLTGANLTNACLFQTILSDADKETATLNGALFSLEKFQTLKSLLSEQSLLNFSNTPTNTDVWFQKTANMRLIESLDGEPISPIDLYDDDSEDETVFGVNPGDYYGHE